MASKSDDKALVARIKAQPPSTERLLEISNYFLENGMGPKAMLEVVSDMLKAETSVFDYKTKEWHKGPDLKMRDKGLGWLWKIHAEWISDKEKEQLPAHIVQVYNDLRGQMQSMSPQELDDKYGIKVG